MTPQPDARPRTNADVALEVAEAKSKDPGALAAELRLAKSDVQIARGRYVMACYGLARKVDRAAAAYGEAFVFDSLETTEQELLDLVGPVTADVEKL